MQDSGGCRLQGHQDLSGDEDGVLRAGFKELFMGFMPTVKEGGPGDIRQTQKK